MRRITLIFALLLSLMGVRQANAETVTDDFTSYSTTSSGQTLGDNWYVFPGDDGNYGRFGSDYTYKKNTYDGADYNYVSGYSSNYTKNVWLVLTKEVSGTVSFRSKMGRNSGTLYVTNKVTAVGDGTFTVDKTGAQSYSVSTTAASNSYDAGSSACYVAFCLTSDQMRLLDVTYTEYVVSDGPALKVSGDNDGSLNFGMVNPGATKELTLSNPGTKDITVNITTTGGFTADATKTTIAAGGNETLTIAAPSTIGASTGTVTITPTVDTVEPVEISLSCIIKDPTKLFEDFSGNALPEDWTSTGSWSFADGYANGGNNTSLQLTTPAMVFEADETFAFEAAGSSSWEPGYGSNYAGTVTVQTSTDGQTFTDLQSFSGIHYNEWQSFSVTIPEGTKFVRFVSKYASIDNVYGGKLDETPRPKLEVVDIANGGSLSWGYSDVPAGSTKTITLKNDGTANLEVSIAATNDYTVDPASATVAAEGGTVDVTIGTPAHDGNGVLTITPAEGSGLSPYTINLTSYYKEPKPVMAIDKTSVAFGKVNEVKSETITVSNTGDADLIVSIENDNAENFTVAPAESLTVAPGETGEITITYNYVEGTWGTFNANVKLTPNYGGTYDVKTIAVSATSKDPNVWSEDFEEGTLATTWNNEGKWSVSKPASSGNNGTYMATISSYNDPKSLTTPRLEAKAGDALTFYVGMQYSDEPLTIEYTNDDKATWTAVVEPVTASGEITFTAPADGFYYVRFTGTYAMLDNFNGFKLAMKDHEIEISANNIPAEGNQYAEYTATATVKELVGVEEEATAKLYVNGEEVAAAKETVAANGTAAFTLTYVPEEDIKNGVAQIVVTYAGGELTTDEVTVNIAAAPVLNETAASEITTGTVDALVLKYTPKAGWNTICVPFALTEDILNQIFGEGWKAYEYKGYSNGEFTFRKATFFAAGYPYLVFAQDAQAAADGFKIEKVNITAATENSDSYGGATFKGTYAPMVAGTMEGKYGVVPNAEDIPSIKKGGANATLKGYRGYFEIPADGGVKGFSFTLVDDATGISQFVATPENGAIYDLNGNKVKNLVKGQVYIMNGQKILVK